VGTPERQEREEEQWAGPEVLGAVRVLAGGEEPPLFLLTPSFIASAGEDENRGGGVTISFVISFVLFI